MKPDGIWGGGASYPGKPYWPGVERCERHHKTEPKRRTRSGEGPEGGRFTGSTEDSGPMKPGNSVEEKTLTTRGGIKDLPSAKPGCSNFVVGAWEAVDERRQ